MLEGLKVLFQILLVVSSILYLSVQNLICPDEFRFIAEWRTIFYDSLEGLYNRFKNPFTETALLLEIHNKLLDDKQGKPSKFRGVSVIYNEYDSKGKTIRKHGYSGRSKDSNAVLHIFTNDLEDIQDEYTLCEEELGDDGNVLYRTVELPEKVDMYTQYRTKITYTYISKTYYNSKEMLNKIESTKRLLYEVYGDAVPKHLRPGLKDGRHTMRWLKYLNLM